MDEKNELNDIILNRNSGNSGMKKLMLAVASLAILLIIVVVIMSSLNSGGTSNLPQPIEPPQTNQVPSPVEDDPLFEPMAIDETASEEESLDNVAKKIKEQSQNSELIAGPDEIMIEEETEVVVPAKYEKPVKEEPKQVTKPVEPKPVAKKETVKTAVKGTYYIQVGSFGRFSPDKKFLQKITNSGYSYIIHDAKVNGVSMTKVLVGPYATDKAARKDLPSVRSKIEPGAFLSRI